MIASLTGTVQGVTSTHLVLDVNGVGYAVSVTPAMSTSALVGSALMLHTALIVREDALSLFGFETLQELELFDLLRSVTGVGPKSALAILANLGVEQVRLAVATENDSVFKSVSGIGPKTAKVIAATLAGKLGVHQPVANETPRADSTELVAALVGLGWSERQASLAVMAAQSNLGSSASKEQLLRLALSQLSAGKTIAGE